MNTLSGTILLRFRRKNSKVGALIERTQNLTRLHCGHFRVRNWNKRHVHHFRRIMVTTNRSYLFKQNN